MPLLFKKSLCTGCRLCQLACSAYHEKIFNPEKARLKIVHAYRNDGIQVTAAICVFCGDCEAACPEGAITAAAGYMQVDPEKCTGCGTCVEACPTQVIHLNTQNKSVICDLCAGKPRCVDWCPKGAITVVGKKKEAA